MRPIKFRAWDKDSNIMVYWDVFGNPVEPEQDLNIQHYFEKYFTSLLVSPPMQYTGIKANGKEIYEGDIVRGTINNFTGIKTPFIAEVVFTSGAFCVSIEDGGAGMLQTFFQIDDQIAFEIAGNIYENPELLKDNG